MSTAPLLAVGTRAVVAAMRFPSRLAIRRRNSSGVDLRARRPHAPAPP